MQQEYFFKPRIQYWLTQWLPIFIAVITICTMGVRNNLNTPTSDRAIGFSIFLISALLLIFIRFTRQKIHISASHLTIYTARHSYFWPKEQIEAIDFKLDGKENQPHLYVSTDQQGFNINISAFDSDAVEEAFENWIGLENIGTGAVQTAERYKREQEQKNLVLSQEGENEEYLGGPLSRLFVIHNVMVIIALIVIGLLFFQFDLWPLGVLLLIFTAIWLVRCILFYGSVYMNHDHIVFLNWGKQEMIRWSNVHTVELSEYVAILTGQDKCLVIPGPSYWSSTDLESMVTLFSYQMTERNIFATSDHRWYRPRSRNVRTERPFPFSKK